MPDCRVAFASSLAPLGLGVCLGLLLVAAPARAQVGDPSGGYALQGAPNLGGVSPPPAFGKPQQPPPAALPGARSQPNAVALPSTPPLMLDPTQALFDAINRGDATAAQDAISRGADVNGQNELGLTPVQVSVDLGRNDITFLLLSNGAGRASGGPTAAQLAGGQKPGKGTKAANILEAHQNAQARVSRVRVTEKMPAAQRELPQLYANDGGSPVPTAGFLGFGQAR